jgi:hypothetical protein
MPRFPIFGLFNTLTDPEPGANRPDRRWHFGALALAFAVANVAIFFPDTWRYCVAYVQGGMLVHHGNPYAGQLYVTNIPISPLGIPVTYYLRLIATKVPLAVLGAALAGGIELVRRRHERGFVLLRVLLLFLLVPYSLMAAKFLRSPSRSAVIDILPVSAVSGSHGCCGKGGCHNAHVTAGPSRCWLSARSRRGVRRSVSRCFRTRSANVSNPRSPRRSCDSACAARVRDRSVGRAGAVIVSDAPDVVAHYLKLAGVRISGRPRFVERHPSRESEVWVIVRTSTHLRKPTARAAIARHDAVARDRCRPRASRAGVSY